MSTTRKSLALTAVIAASIAVMAADSAPRSRADELRSAAPSSVQGGAAQSASGQGSSAQSTWDAVTLGRVEPRLGEIKITAPLPGGRIAEVLVKPNDEVFAGELLARLDDEDRPSHNVHSAGLKIKGKTGLRGVLFSMVYAYLIA